VLYTLVTGRSLYVKTRSGCSPRTDSITDQAIEWHTTKRSSSFFTLAAGKLIWDFTIARLTEGGETDRAIEGPAVFLPEQHPRLLELVKGNKKDGEK